MTSEILASGPRNLATAGDGCSISWGEVGTGDADHTVVLVHGITESGETWSPLVELLATSYRVIWMDLRGHGQSGHAQDYSLQAMAGDVVAVIMAAGLERPHLIGHSLGGVVVSIVGALLPVGSVINVDQTLQLGAFNDQLQELEDALRDPDMFPAVIEALFAELGGPALSESERERLDTIRRANQEVVLAVWAPAFALGTEETNAIVQDAMDGYRQSKVPYLTLFGRDPGQEYGPWLNQLIPTSTIEVWGDTGHYPHLVRPQQFIDRATEFWGHRQG